MAQLPAEALPIILALLPAQSLGRAACVCTAWRAAAAAPALWRAAYAAMSCLEDMASLRRAAALAGAEAADWRAAVREEFLSGAGWRTGRCTVRQLPLSAGGADLLTLVDDHLLVCCPDGTLDVHALLRGDGTAITSPARPTRLRGRHDGVFVACDGDPGSGLVLTASEGAACVWRSAACMARRGEGALLATLPNEDDWPVEFALLLPQHHAGASAQRGTPADTFRAC